MKQLKVFSEKLGQNVALATTGAGIVSPKPFTLMAASWSDGGWSNTYDNWMNSGWTHGYGGNWTNSGWTHGYGGNWVNSGWTNGYGGNWSNSGWSNGGGK